MSGARLISEGDIAGVGVLVESILTAARAEGLAVWLVLTGVPDAVVGTDLAVVVGQHPPLDGTRLTPREREVLAVLAEGLTNKQIAARLSVSVKTVMHHSVAIYRKLGVRGRAAATAYAHQSGLVAPPR